MGIGSFPGVKRPGCGVDFSPPSSAEVKERVVLYLYSPSGPSWPVIGWTLPLSLPLPMNVAVQSVFPKLSLSCRMHTRHNTDCGVWISQFRIKGVLVHILFLCATWWWLLGRNM